MKKVISYILSFSLSIFLIALMCLFIASNTILNKDFLLKQIQENDYYNLIDINIQSEIEGYIKQSGFDKEVFEELYSKEHLKEDIDSIIISLYNGEKTSLNEKVLEDNLRNKIDLYLQTNNITLKQNEQKKVDEFVQKIVDIYVNEVSHPVYLETISKVIIKVEKIIPVVQKSIYGAVIITSILIIVMNIKQVVEGIRYIAISMLSASLFIFCVILLFKNKINIDNILILNSTFSLLVINILKIIIKKFIIVAEIGFVISLITAFLTNMKKIKKTIAKNA